MVHCPTCGSSLRFDIGSQLMVCDHCRNSFQPRTLPDRTSDDAKTEAYLDSYAYICPSCGAEIDTADKNDAVGFCPYCKGSSMIFDKLRRDWKPNGIIPFKITKEQCKELYKKEVKKHIFVSHKYCDPELIEDFRGIYMPYCSFFGTVDGNVKLRSKTPEKNIGNYDYQTLYYDLHGEAQYIVKENFSHESSVSFDDHISERLDPYDENVCEKFHPAYLSGFYAETGNIDISEWGPVVYNDMFPYVCDVLGNTPQIKGVEASNNVSVVTDSSENFLPLKITLSERKLFPVWFMSYRRGEKITYAAVNGQTGKVAADLPLSPPRILTAALIFSAVFLGILMYIMNFLPTIPAAATLGITSILDFTGMYILQHCYLRTIGHALHQPDMTKKLSFGFIISILILTVGFILMTTDGSYEHNRFSIGLMMSIMIFFVLFSYIGDQSSRTKKIKKIELKNASMQANGILVEAKKFNKLNALMRGIMFITLVIFIFVMIAGSVSSGVYYLLSAIEAVELFVLALMQINFQTNVAKRRLPQFNKKGAAYDTK